MWIAFTREVSPSITRCELTHQARSPIDLALARAQHRAYVEALVALGAEVRALPPAPELPDAVFVEDGAVVLDELAVITRPGAASRRAETESIAAALASERPLAFLREPATLDGGDVLRLGRTLYVGLGGRTNEVALEQLAALVSPHGYDVVGVPVRGCLHLKSAVTEAATGLLLVHPACVDPACFPGFRALEVDPSEPAAANVLRVGEGAIYSTSHPRTRERLERAGVRLRPVDASEVEKAEGAVTCCSLVLRARA